jgi:hypothetical protein
VNPFQEDSLSALEATTAAQRLAFAEETAP